LLPLKWIPKWIGEIYSKIWAQYGENTFLFSDVEEFLGKLTPNYLSELKKAEALYIFGKESRKRIYRLVSPNIFSFSLANKLKISWLKQGRYAHLILKIFKCLKDEFRNSLISFAVYGSIARNSATNDSDLDIFLVSQKLPDSLGKRLNLLLNIEETTLIQEEIAFLAKNKCYTRLNFYPCDVSELKVNYFTIDIAFDLQIVYDLGVLNEFFSSINNRIKEQGIIRKYLDDERYYLDLNLKAGEVFEF